MESYNYINFISFAVDGTHAEAMAWLNAPTPEKTHEQLLESGRKALTDSRLGDLAAGVMDPSLTAEQSKCMLIGVSFNFH